MATKGESVISTEDTSHSCSGSSKTKRRIGTQSSKINFSSRSIDKKRKSSNQSSSCTASDDDSPSDDLQICQSASNSKTQQLNRSFFDVQCLDLAKNLLGQKIVRKHGSQRLSGRIVETEAYLGGDDKAAHSYKGKRTARNEAMFMEPGTSYVYNINGMYCCLNISSRGDGAAVLIRALEAVEGQDTMREERKPKNSNKTVKDKELTNGPSKLCQALNISKNDFNKVDLTSSDILWLEDDMNVDPSQVVSSARINIGYAEEWTDKPFRFYILGNESVSVRRRQNRH